MTTEQGVSLFLEVLTYRESIAMEARDSVDAYRCLIEDAEERAKELDIRADPKVRRAIAHLRGELAFQVDMGKRISENFATKEGE